ncbi:MAG: hypothetical protein COA57_01550 [Flavobacteriales bacterium]|nr:MAG: hypothetical protein COA57_01550 [Flavobacteriales bacterium]
METTACVDFSNSFLTWETKESSYGRFQVEAILRCFDNGALLDQYLLLAGVMACDVYGEQGLIYEPAFHFQAIFSRNQHKIFRTHANLKKNADNWGNHEERFSKITPSISKVKSAAIHSFEEIESATLSNRNLNVKIPYRVDGKQFFELEFPIKHINIHAENKKFQVETGPILIPRGAPADDAFIDKLQIAYVAFNKLAEFEFIPFTAQKIGFLNNIRFYAGKEIVTSQIQICRLN